MSSSANGTHVSPTWSPLSDHPRELELSLDLAMVATITAGICYGFLAMLCFNCFSVLLRSKHMYPGRMRLCFLSYVVIMFLLSTGALVQQIGFMIWDFKVLVVPWLLGTPNLWQTGGTTPYALPIIMISASLGTGISYFRTVSQTTPIINPDITDMSPLVIVILVPLVNFILTSLLAVRILYQQARLRRLLEPASSWQSSYTKIVMICVESSALIVVVGAAGIAVYFLPWYYELLPSFLLPHICVISSLLIVYRVAQGRSFETIASGSGRGRMTAINFRDNTVPSEC
ncbi:hypothetical protein D9613_010485 [Agrocybe pediades]|uniref:Uncharacterized protein n=1 Tax=Agrocybe pediades TaxID=84607 RepID=A0A8H4QGN4_9AGAR|nr:hypothetical protein D9613_010485 [Agrocybe pediades]